MSQWWSGTGRQAFRGPPPNPPSSMHEGPCSGQASGTIWITKGFVWVGLTGERKQLRLIWCQHLLVKTLSVLTNHHNLGSPSCSVSMHRGQMFTKGPKKSKGARGLRMGGEKGKPKCLVNYEGLLSYHTWKYPFNDWANSYIVWNKVSIDSCDKQRF